MESRQLMSITTSVVNVPISAAAQAADATLASLRTVDLKVTVSSGDDFLAANVLLPLTTGSFYNVNVGGDSAEPSIWSTFPYAEFDTFVTGPNFAKPTILGRAQGSGSAVFSPTQVNVGFGDLDATGAGTYTIARLTMSRDSAGTLSGGVFSNDAPSQEVPFSFNITPVASANTGTIEGYVFNDQNDNGAKNDTEGKLSGWQVFIDANNNGKLDSGEKSVSTRSNGNFTLPDVAAGTYRVRMSLKSGWRRTAPVNSSFSFNVAVTAGQASINKKFGVTQQAQVYGLVFGDTNGDGAVGRAETGLSGYRVYIDRDNDGRFDAGETSVRSGSDGSWGFGNLKPGTYNIRVVGVTGFSQTTPSSGKLTVTVGNGEVKVGQFFGQRAV